MTRASTAADALVARLRPIWPAPTSLRVAHWPRVRARGDDFLVLPSVRRPVLLIPAARTTAAGAIVRHDDGQRARASLRLLAWAQAHGLLRWAPVGRVRVQGDSAVRTSGVLAAVHAAVPDADAVVVRLGRPRHGRTVVLQALDRAGTSVAFAKCAWGDRVADLRLEHRNLVDVADAPAPGVRSPGVLDYSEVGDGAALVLEALVPSAPVDDDPGVPVEAMQALAGARGWEPATLASSPVLTRLTADIATVADPEARAWLGRERDRLVRELGDCATRVGGWHGDWVPWNMAREPEGVLLWDWEHHQQGVLPGFDHVHYLAQDLRQRAGTTTAVEDDWLACAREALRGDWGLSADEAEATIRSYLLVVNLRYVTDREGDPTGANERTGWGRDLLGRLGADAHSLDGGGLR